MTDKPNLADARRAVVMRVVIRARCYECAWTETGPDADKAAEKHMKRTGHHSTGSKSVPEEEK